MKQFFKDFGKFIAKGNVLDLAVGMVIGAAFNAIVSSLVNDMIMPLVGLAVKSDIASLKVELVPAVTNEAGEIIKKAVTLNYGNFIQTIVNFFIIALSIFVALRTIMAVRRKFDNISKTVKDKIEEHKEEKENITE